MRRHMLSVLGGVGIATVFFLPVVAAGRIDGPLLMWTPRHTVELAFAWFACSCAGALALAWLAGDRSPRRESFLLLVLALPSMLSIVAVTGRSGLVTVDSSDPLRSTLVVGIVAFVVLAVALWVFLPVILVKAIRRLLPIGAIFLVPAVLTLRTLPMNAAPLPAPHAPAVERHADAAASCGNVIVLAFDELAYDAVFSGGEPTLPSLTRRKSSARLFHRALASTASTDTSISAYVAASPRRGASQDGLASGLFGVARSLGLRTEVIGWYFPYCESLGSYADQCRSYSMYNASTLYDRFNPLAPIATVLNIWPYQLPTGVLKRPMAVWLHASELEAIVSAASLPPSAAPVFRWVHLNTPHVPWIEQTGFLSLHAFQNTRERYLRQVNQVDRALERILTALEQSPGGRRTTVIITADHGSRAGHAGDPLHVPLIVWRPGGKREDVSREVRVAEMLKSLVAGTCQESEAR